MGAQRHLPQHNRERGTSLLEVLIALFIMLLLMLGVLQMFTMAYLENLGSAARTDLTFRAQQFVENLRLLNALSDRTPSVTVANTGITFPLADTGGVAHTVNPATATYWGSTGANVVTTTSPFTLAYQIVDPSPAQPTGLVTVTVTITPATTGAYRYKGIGIRRKTIEYTAQVAK